MLSNPPGGGKLGKLLRILLQRGELPWLQTRTASNTETTQRRGKKILNKIVAHGVRPHLLKEKYLVVKKGFPEGFRSHLKLRKLLI